MPFRNSTINRLKTNALFHRNVRCPACYLLDFGHFQGFLALLTRSEQNTGATALQKYLSAADVNVGETGVRLVLSRY